jgi:hypothetical protein
LTRLVTVLALELAFVLSLGPVGAQTTNSYSTSFSLTENPISEGGRWISGRTIGLDWSNVRTASNLAYGTQTGSGGFNDSIAVLSGSWGPTQSAQGTVRSINQRTDTIHEEVEILLRFTISAHFAAGYECLFAARTDANRYMQIVRWNGAFGNFTLLWAAPGPGIRDGDVVKCSISGSTITSYVNGVQVLQYTDSTPINSGAPGIGFYIDGGNGTLNADYGFTSYSASDSGSPPRLPAPPTNVRITS